MGTKETSSTFAEQLASEIAAALGPMRLLSRHDINHRVLIAFLEQALEEQHIKEITASNDVCSNEVIVDAVIGIFQFLSQREIERYYERVLALSLFNDGLIARLSVARQQRLSEIREARTANLIGAVIGIAIISVLGYFISQRDQGTEEQAKSRIGIDYQPLRANIHKRSRYRHKSLLTGASPYDDFFGPGVVSRKSKNELRVTNLQAAHVIVCLTEVSGAERTIRNEYVKAGETFVMHSIPNGVYKLKYFYGRYWNPDTLLLRSLKGGFDTLAGFQVSDRQIDWLEMTNGNTSYSVTLKASLNGNMKTRESTLEEFVGHSREPH